MKRLRRRDVTVIVGPTPDDWIELTNQIGLIDTPVLADQFPNLVQKGVRILFGGSDKQLAAELAQVLTKKVEAFLDGGHPSLFLGELQTPILQELLDQGSDFILQHFFGCAGDNESSHPRELPPQVLTEPDVSVSTHPALLIEACPHSNDQCANILVCFRAIRASH